MARKRFKRTAIASSSSYVVNSHIRMVQEHLNGTYTKKEIIEAQISLSIKPTYWTKCFGNLIQINEAEALTLSSQITIIIK